MKCGACGGRSEVLETIQRGDTTKRRRQCLACGARFMTTETRGEVPAQRRDVVDEMPEWLAKIKASQHKRRHPRLDPDAIMDALRVDARRAQINAGRRLHDQQTSADLRDAGFDELAEEIDRESMRREIEGY